MDYTQWEIISPNTWKSTTNAECRLVSAIFSHSVQCWSNVLSDSKSSTIIKAENVIIVSTIPGPKEPDCNHMNNYLELMVNDLLLLWKGINIKIPQSVLESKLIQAALSYISSDLPATRKLCGFYGYHATYGCSKCLKNFLVHLPPLPITQDLIGIYGNHDLLSYIEI